MHKATRIMCVLITLTFVGLSLYPTSAQASFGTLFFAESASYPDFEDNGQASIYYLNGFGQPGKVVATGGHFAYDPIHGHLAYESGSVSQHQLVISNLDGSSNLRILATAANLKTEAWSPNGDYLVFAAGTPESIYLVNLTQQTATQITPPQPMFVSPGLQVQSDNTPQAVGKSHTKGHKKDNPGNGIGHNPHDDDKITTNPCLQSDKFLAPFAWAPTEDRVVYSVYFYNPTELLLCQIKLGEDDPTILASSSELENLEFRGWSMDGKSVLVETYDQMTGQAQVLFTDGQNRTIIPTTQSPRQATLSWDGKRMAYVNFNAQNQICVHEMPTSQEICTTPTPYGLITALAMSPTGDKVAFIQETSGSMSQVFVMDLTSKVTISVTPNSKYHDNLIWTP